MTPQGKMIKLSEITQLKRFYSPPNIERENKVRTVTVSSALSGSDIGTVKAALEKEIAKMDIPKDVSIDFGGSAENMKDSFKDLAMLIVFSLILVYIVMASQFESLKQPFVVMFTVPLAFIGVAFALFITQTTISVASFVGVIILGGIVVNNGIVLIDYTNQLRNQGIEKHEALLKAGYDRLRPVFITSFTTVIGMLPMAISQGEGSEMKSPMAITIIGGLLSATFFTLVVIPVIYSLVDKISFKSSKNS